MVSTEACALTHTFWDGRIEEIRSLILLELRGGVLQAIRDNPDRRCLLANDAMDGSSGDAVTLRQLTKTLPLVAIA